MISLRYILKIKYKKYVNHSIKFTTPNKFKFINSNIWYPITSINNICSIFLMSQKIKK